MKPIRQISHVHRDDDNSDLYTLDLVSLKYINNRFVQQTYQDFMKAIQNQKIEGDKLFIKSFFCHRKAGK